MTKRDLTKYIKNTSIFIAFTAAYVLERTKEALSAAWVYTKWAAKQLWYIASDISHGIMQFFKK